MRVAWAVGGTLAAVVAALAWLVHDIEEAT
jgi:hypothetical protein